jgi:hypothetical protein
MAVFNGSLGPGNMVGLYGMYGLNGRRLIGDVW